MTSKYSEAQRKATQHYRSKMGRVDLTITQEEKTAIQNRADSQGKSIKEYIMGLVRKDLNTGE